jgi:predicted acylesterase/phospholipase RssA
MPPDPILDQLIRQAKTEKAARRFDQAAQLFTKAGQQAAAVGDEVNRKAMLRPTAICLYLNPAKLKDCRKKDALALLTEDGPAPGIAALLSLASALKGENAFGRARILLAEARGGLRKLIQQMPIADEKLRSLELKARQQHGLCTYKDVDSPPADRFDDALRILNGKDLLAIPGTEGLAATHDQETLGITGAVHKAMWKYDAQRAHLHTALYYYARELPLADDDKLGKAIAADNGYTAINAAFVLDLLAFLEARDVGPDLGAIALRKERARTLRQKILATLPGMASEETKKQWWFAATLAEAEFGLGQYEAAAKELKDARTSTPVEDWEFESTARQLASLLPLCDGDEASKARAKQAFSEGLGIDNQAAALIVAGKIGLALSGGGFRASLFHIGVLARLAELDVLRHVDVLSCVSGGSIIGAYYYLKVRDLFARKTQDQMGRDDFLKIVHDVAAEFLKGVQTNVRTLMVSNFFKNLGMLLRNASRTERIGELLELKLYSSVGDDGRRELGELIIQPIDWQATQQGPFQPKFHNWRQKTKAPILVLNATTINTGHNWQFTTSFMGESPLAIDPEVDGNDRMRRLYYGDAPTDELKTLRLGKAVGASACVPVLFEPIVLAGLYPGRTVRLADGGVHDNQGVVSLLEQDCTILLVSDASGHVGVEDDPKSSEFGVAVRSNDLLMARVRGAQYRDLKGRLRSGVIRGLMFLHLRKDLDVDPIDWVRCQDASPPAANDPMTSYRIRKDVQDRLASIRTDLDSFNEAEAFALMTSGYCMTDQVFPLSISNLLETKKDRATWPFLEIHGAIADLAPAQPEAHADLMNVLDVGRHQFFKIFYLTPWLMRTAKVCIGIVLIALLAACLVYRSYPLLTAGMIASWAIAALVAFISVSLAKLIFLKQTILGFVRNLLIALFGWAIAGLHLLTFDKWYLRRGTDYRVLKRPFVPPP